MTRDPEIPRATSPVTDAEIAAVVGRVMQEMHGKPSPVRVRGIIEAAARIRDLEATIAEQAARIALLSRDTTTLVAQAQEQAARIERLTGLLWYAWHEFNAIRARHGAPITSDGMPTCTEDWWKRMTEAFGEAIGEDARKPWPSSQARSALGEQP